MKVIDSDRYAEAGVETLFFPGGEPHVKVPLETGGVLLYLKLRTWNDVGFAALAVDAFGRQGQLRGVFIPYFPAARQDKTDGRAPLSVEVMGRLIGRTPVCVFDPHSAKLAGYVNMARAFMPEDLDVPRKADVVGIIAPDAGAQARATRFRDKFYPGMPVLLATKSRDPQTGKLSNYQLPAFENAGRYIIVDDICDGGGTFNLLAEAFARRAAELRHPCSLDLFVSHGLFSKGLEAISPVIGQIVTTDSWCQLPGNDRLHVISLAPILEALASHDQQGEKGA
jgi:ribose-phosphate pyrophosphokinase